MVIIKGMMLDLISAIDDECGYFWRKGELPEYDVGCANVTLEESTILKAYGKNDYIVLTYGGHKIFINESEFVKVEIS